MTLQKTVEGFPVKLSGSQRPAESTEWDIDLSIPEESDKSR